MSFLHTINPSSFCQPFPHVTCLLSIERPLSSTLIWDKGVKYNLVSLPILQYLLAKVSERSTCSRIYTSSFKSIPFPNPPSSHAHFVFFLHFSSVLFVYVGAFLCVPGRTTFNQSPDWLPWGCGLLPLAAGGSEANMRLVPQWCLHLDGSIWLTLAHNQ